MNNTEEYQPKVVPLPSNSEIENSEVGICGDISETPKTDTSANITTETNRIDTEAANATLISEIPAATQLPRKFAITINPEQRIEEETCPDGDFVLNFCVLPANPADNSRPALGPNCRFRISSAVIHLAASDFLGKVLHLAGNDELVVSGQKYLPGDELVTFSGKVHVAYLRPGDLGLAIRLHTNSKLAVQKWSHAILVLFKILHFQHVDEHLPDLELIMYIAEVAWALGCLSPVKPWLNLWTHKGPGKYDPEIVKVLTSPSSIDLACGLLGLALNDRVAFGSASLNWIWHCSLESLKRIEHYHISVTPSILYSLIKNRQIVLAGLSKILTSMYNEYKPPTTGVPQNLRKNVAMGLLIRSLEFVFSNGSQETMQWHLKILQWSGNLHGLILQFNILARYMSHHWRLTFDIQDSNVVPEFGSGLCSERFECFKSHLKEVQAPVLEYDSSDDTVLFDPGKVLWDRVEQLCNNIHESRLDDFKPKATKLLDVYSYMQLNCDRCGGIEPGSE